MNFRLRELRKDKGLRQVDLAQILGISPQSLGYYENQVNKPDPDMLIKIANYFNVTIDYLLGREDDFGNVTVTTASPSAALTPDEQEILETYRNLPPHRRKTFMLFVESCNEESTYKNKKA